MEITQSLQGVEPPARPARELARRSMVKTVSWRTIASLDTMLLSFLVLYFMQPSGTSETVAAAGVIAAIEVPNKLLLYYFHERVWARFRWGQSA